MRNYRSIGKTGLSFLSSLSIGNAMGNNTPKGYLMIPSLSINKREKANLTLIPQENLGNVKYNYEVFL